MGITAALAVDLALLTAALDEPGADIAASVIALGNTLSSTIDSYVGLTVSVSNDASGFTLTTLDDPVDVLDVATSLRVPFAVDGEVTPSAVLTVYARTPGAFVDLAADLSWVTGSPSSATVFDPVDPPIPGAAPTVAQTSRIQQAIGVLIGQGHTPEAAQRHLASGPTDVATAAELILDAVVVHDPIRRGDPR